MAIFYEHIKGCGPNSGKYTGPAGSNTFPIAQNKTEWQSDAWTWIKFAPTLYYTKASDNKTDLQYAENNPYFKFDNENYEMVGDHESLYSTGRIITSHARGQKIHYPFEFTEGIIINKDTTTGNLIVKGVDGSTTSFGDTSRINITLLNQSRLLLFGPNIGRKPGEADPLKWGSYASFRLRETNDKNPYLEISCAGNNMNWPVEINTSQLLIKGSDTTTSRLKVEGSLETTSKCEALYFNAKSDKRAKENITPTKFSALSIVNSIQTYTFNYKSQPDKKVLGIIAQDAATKDLDGFNMVDNLNATGIGNDMMQMKESKLVYVLWKAVQELSAEVEDLKAQITSLK